jgi:hypothetical protein
MIMNKRNIEHFCTLFDSNFLPMGMTLHESLMTHAQPFHLWIICMDELVKEQLEMLNLNHVSLIPIQAIETAELLAVKSERSRGEYCWTVTPFTFQAVWERAPHVEQVTYLDADLFFFDDPQILLKEFDESAKQVLITEHAYAPEYDQTLTSGRFCVQFLTFKNTPEATKVMKWWQDRCLEWCFARYENGKFGDQKYLDIWPELFPNEVHILQQTEKTLAPWNVKFIEKKMGGAISPVFYHFHSLRIISPHQVLLYIGYQIGKKGLGLYDVYIRNLSRSLNNISLLGISRPYMLLPQEKFRYLRYIKRKLFKQIQFVEI